MSTEAANLKKVVDPVDLKQMFTSLKKFTRRTVPLGKYDATTNCHVDEVYLREMNVSAAGVGCAVWDAAIIMARWIHSKSGGWFAGKVVHEVGAGVGLPGIVSGRHASRVLLSDHMPQLVTNLQYNITLNCNEPDELPATHPERSRISKERANLAKAAVPLLIDYTDCKDITAVEGMSLADIILGSEVVYTANIDYITALVNFVHSALKPDGVFLYDSIHRTRGSSRPDPTINSTEFSCRCFSCAVNLSRQLSHETAHRRL